MHYNRRYFTRFIFLSSLLLMLACHSSSNIVSPKQQHDSDPLFMEGEKAKLTGNTGKAKEIFGRYIELFPGDGAGYYELARLTLNDYDFDKTLGLLKKAVSLEPDNKYYQLLYAKVLVKAGDLAAADKEYEKYIKHFSAGMEIYKQYVNLLVRENKIQKAIDLYDRLEEKTCINREISMQKKDLYLMQGKMEKAIQEIEKLSAAFPGDIHVLYTLADLYSSNKQSGKALAVYKKILRSDPDDPYVYLGLADYYSKHLMRDSSLIFIQKSFHNPQLDIEVKENILKTLSREDYDYTTLNMLAQTLLQVHPNDASAYTMFGDIEYEQRHFLSADSAYRKSLRLNPDQYEVWENLLYIDERTNRPDSSINDGLKVIALFPVQPIPYLLLGAAYYKKKEYQKAVEILEEGKQWTLNQIDLSIRFNVYLGDAYNELKNYEASDKAYDMVLLLSPDDDYTLNNYAYFLALRGEKLEKAKEMAKRACALDEGNASYLDTYAWTLFKSKEYSGAGQQIIKAIQAGGDKNPVILEHYGDILWKLGKHKEAVEKWKEAAKAGNASALLQKKIKYKKWFEK